MPEESRYRQIARDLRKRIQDGELTSGDRLPSEKELEDEFGASRNTIRLALGTLRNQGLVESRAGRGTFVQQVIPMTFHASLATRRTPEAPEDSGDIEDVEFAELGGQTRAFAELLIQSATPEIASRLRVDEGSMVVVRRTFRYVDDRSASVETSYYPMDIAQRTELMLPEDIGRGALHVLHELGYTQVGYVDELRSRMPTPEEAQQLELPPGIPVMELYRTGFSKNRAIRLSWTVFAGNGIRFQYEIGDIAAYHAE
ncbi:GntR family transcriptional regulator [Murinocardiopsis flavida]|uniref:GntR family transcriptional regulator n=1 Tax=Murinocardiopsis flavida TaxID=645275 RepID=A0A2P8CQX8_9ACTN|nr:GntR family transcriptional regulator [Murinocardiopsis flavida]PSK87356.1 GntR family transcriptional regulator [Murinocardiopsis flavida]